MENLDQRRGSPSIAAALVFVVMAVACSSSPPRAKTSTTPALQNFGFSRTRVDGSLDSLGRFNSIAIGADGLPVVSYRDRTDGGVRVAHCNDAACSKAKITTIDHAGRMNLSILSAYTSLDIAGDGNPVVAYDDVHRHVLKLAHCSDATCASATLSVVDTSHAVDGFASIAIASSGFPVIAYQGARHLRVASCSDVSCSSSVITTPDRSPNTGAYTSIAIGRDAAPLIAYYDQANKDVRVAHCLDAGCRRAETARVDGARAKVGEFASLAIGRDGRGVISYHDDTNDDLRVAHCVGVACRTAPSVAVATKGFQGTRTSMAIGADGRPIISYHDYQRHTLDVARCNDVACARATIATIDVAQLDTEESSIAIGRDGLPIVAYWNPIDHDLMVVHCGSADCSDAQHEEGSSE